MMNAMRNRLDLDYLVLALLLVAFFGYFAVRVWDIDFWWHIAAGREILEKGAIPGADPFGMYDADNSWGQTVLKSQWLGQVLLYLVYHWFDLDGVILFRAAVLTACLAMMYWRCRLSGATSMFSLAITALSGLAILHHTGERPQLLSFFYLSLMFLLLDGYLRSSRPWQLYCVPLVMLVWSNTHAGAVLGLVALGLFSAGYLLENRLQGRNWKTHESVLILKMLGLSAIAAAANPNGVATLVRIIFVENVFFVESNPLRDRVSEYAYPWTLWPATLYYWIFVAVFLVSLPGLVNRHHLKHGLMLAAICIVSLTGYRYIPFFVLLAGPYMAASLDRMSGNITFLPVASVNLAAGVAALVMLGYGFRQGEVFQRGLQEDRFPAGAVEFMQASRLEGKIFNTMNWGGYLVWQMHGMVRPFIDGRILDPRRLVPYTHILWMTPEGRQFFDRERFDMVLVPQGNAFSGERYPLVPYLLHDPDWLEVYQDRRSYLFVRKTGQMH